MSVYLVKGAFRSPPNIIEDACDYSICYDYLSMNSRVATLAFMS